VVLKAFSTFLGMVFGLALLLALLAGGYFLFSYTVDIFGTLEPQLATVTAIASVVVLLSAMIVASGLRSRSSSKSEAASHDEKAQLYRQVLSMTHSWQPPENEEGSGPEVERLKIKQNLALWGSPEVISAYAELERRTLEDGVEPLLQKLVMAMRKDLGQTASTIKPDDLRYLMGWKRGSI
jgi:hypothetical protein